MKADIKVSRESVISAIDDRLYSSFIEHMGRAIYTGIYEPGHPTAGQDGFRQDVIYLIKPLELSHIRYPGGNFVSGYRWEDGVGDRASRPVRRDLAWMALEPNEIGTNEFIDYCRQVGAQPMMAVNLGTRGPQEAVDLVEYCNVEGGTYLSDLRRSHGWEKPHDVKLWCLGNEMDGPWQMCAKTADEYGRTACEAAKLMKWMDPSIELVACGSSNHGMPTFGEWERTVLRHCGQYVDYLSLHQYYQNNDGDIPSFLALSGEMDSFIREVADICRQYKEESGSERDIYLSFDEWNVWYHFWKKKADIPMWTVGRAIEEEDYDFADALLVGGMLTTLINNADTVKIACMAQLINVIAPIMTEPGGRAWVQTIYYPLLLTSQHGRGTALAAQIECPEYSCSLSEHTPYLDCAAVLSKDEREVTFFIVNKNLEEAAVCDISMTDFGSASSARITTLFSDDLAVPCTPDSNAVHQSESELQIDSPDHLTAELPPASWNMVRVILDK